LRTNVASIGTVKILLSRINKKRSFLYFPFYFKGFRFIFSRNVLVMLFMLLHFYLSFIFLARNAISRVVDAKISSISLLYVDTILS
jgi:hypothetical protein